MSNFTTEQLLAMADGLEARGRDMFAAAKHLRDCVASGKPAFLPAPIPRKLVAREAAIEALRESGKPMALADIQEAVLAKGAKSKSATNLSSMMSLEREHFVSESHGVWGLREWRKREGSA